MICNKIKILSLAAAKLFTFTYAFYYLRIVTIEYSLYITEEKKNGSVISTIVVYTPHSEDRVVTLL